MQGFGNVGSSAAELFHGAGGEIVAVQDHTGTIANPRGLDLAALMPHVRETGGVGGFNDAEALDDEAFWDVDCDILIPAALEGQITPASARTASRPSWCSKAPTAPRRPGADDIMKTAASWSCPT